MYQPWWAPFRLGVGTRIDRPIVAPGLNRDITILGAGVTRNVQIWIGIVTIWNFTGAGSVWTIVLDVNINLNAIPIPIGIHFLLARGTTPAKRPV
jgi:hypothetical protein